MKIAFLLYPTSRVKVDEDSTFWIMLELKKRGHFVAYFESQQLMWREGKVQAFLRNARLDPKKGFLPSPLTAVPAPLESMDVIFIRKEPPFDNEYLYALQLLSLLNEKVFVLNDPAGIAVCNEKLSILEFKKFIAETLVTDNADEAFRFARSLNKEIVVKPLNQKGGSGIYKTSARQKDFHSRVYASMLGGSQKVMVQRYLTENKKGDKRILVLNGEILGSFLRRPAGNDFRANLGLGGTMHASGVTPRERKLVDEMAPWFLRHGLYFVGLDVIGGYLSEINITSPSGIPEIRQLGGKRLEKDVADFIEQRR